MQNFLANRRRRFKNSLSGRPKFAVFASLAAFCFLLTACGTPGPEPTPTPSASIDFSKPNPSASSLPTRTEPLVDPSTMTDECAIFEKIGELNKQGYFTSVEQTRSEVKARLDIMQRTFTKLAKSSEKGSSWQPVADTAKKASDAFLVYGQDLGNSSFLVALAKFNAELTKELAANKERIEAKCGIKYSELGLG